MIASLANAQALARASARMLAHLALADWCAHERPHIADAMLSLAAADLSFRQVFMTICCDDDEG
jgi:glutathione S-transferase